MSSKLHHLKAAVVATVALSAAGAGVAGATGALRSTDDESKPTTEVTLPASASERAVAALSADHGTSHESHGQADQDHGKSDQDHGKSDQDHGKADADETRDNHGAEVSTFAHSTELEGRERGQAVAALASDGRSADDHGRSGDDHGKADEHRADD